MNSDNQGAAPGQALPSSPIAIVHDWLTGMRGGEKCLKELCSLLPQADIFTLFHLKGSVAHEIESRTVKASFIQRFPGLDKNYRYFLPLFPLAAEGFDLSSYPLVLSISHCVAKGVIPGPGAYHLCYCLTPMRYVWDLYPLYFGPHAPGKPPGAVTRLISHYIRLWDVAASNRVDDFVAISHHVASRIRRYYRREATVIYPPVAWDAFLPASRPQKDYYLVVAAKAPYKRLDIVLEAFSRLKQRVKIVGEQPPLPRGLASLGKRENVEMLGWVPDNELKELYAHCRALIYPGPEDFGIVPVEAQAAGRPVIAYGAGGVLESVRGVPVREASGLTRAQWRAGDYTGIFFAEPTARALAAAVECFEAVENGFKPGSIRRWAKKFDTKAFTRSWKALFKQGGRFKV